MTILRTLFRRALRRKRHAVCNIITPDLHVVLVVQEIKRFGKQAFVLGELRKRGITVADVAARLEVDRKSIYLVTDDRMRSRRIAVAIEELIEVPAGSVFPYIVEAAV